MMPLALALVGLELRLLSWLATDGTESESDDEQVVLPLLTDYRAVKENVKAGKDQRKAAGLDELGVSALRRAHGIPERPTHLQTR